jgi:hypothetical protein
MRKKAGNLGIKTPDKGVYALPAKLHATKGKTTEHENLNH